MKILYLHETKKILTGAQQINHLIARKVKDKGVIIKNVYPVGYLQKIPSSIKRLKKILLQYKIMDKSNQLNSYDIIQGPAYLTASFTNSSIPTLCHFGSTYKGFSSALTQGKKDFEENKLVWKRLRKDKIINRLSFKTKKITRHIDEMEIYAANQATGIIAASNKVKEELCADGVKEEKVFVIHNAVEDLWFKDLSLKVGKIKLVFFSRTGDNYFNWIIKGVDRLIDIYEKFPELEKISIIKTSNKPFQKWLKNNINNHKLFLNLSQLQIKKKLSHLRGGLFLLTSRYEGFSLSLIESMSQGLIPIAYPVGIVPEIIVNGKNGFIVNNIQEACSRINELSKNDQMRKIMSKEAFLTSLNFKSDILADKLINLYEYLPKSSLNTLNNKTIKSISYRNKIDKSILN